ncbi:acyl-CoA dehydrogenase family protein [Marinobacterium sedimentorum]|uniref:acyl-CoA dehydrogenase family protein n=1 Tax=Marinobacterium sedimentorum TaxID=2927804 RepID=UPI0020C704FE|nr:acyl-CoA dehydrogenase family protein [Marinobacterium sedimentorum]MCP8689997.1 acyl-CoA/acyl-ACP dehydrogenase [Marinobacterium sedimentorum]
MQFRFTDEQQMIRDTAASFFADRSGSAAVREAMATDTGYDPQLWQRLCQDLCLHATTIPDAAGGMGLGYVELVAVMEQMGRYLVCSPFFATVCQAVPAVLRTATGAQAVPWLERILAGQTATLAWIGREQPGCAAVSAEYEPTDAGYRLSGEYHFVVDGHSADLLILAARRPGTSGRYGVSLFAIDAKAAEDAGIERVWTPTLDQTRHLARIRLDGLRLDAAACLGSQGMAGAALGEVLQLATVALAAEQMGGAQQVQDMAVAYTGERQQFGRPIASFQAIKHKAADMMLRTEVARSACYYAACIADEAWRGGVLAGELAEAAAIAKSYCSDAFFSNAAEALQLHGGVGFTWEYDVHLYFKRAKASGLMLGDASEHRETLAAQLLDGGKTACS